MLVGSVANGLNSSGGFCACSRIVVDHQRINGTSFVFSAKVPALFAVSASEGINILRNTPSILSTLQENVRAIRAVLDRVEVVTIPSHAASPIVHIHLRSAAIPSTSSKPLNPATPAPRDAPSFDTAGEDHAGAPAALSRKECERAAGVIKAAVVKVLAKRK